MKKIPKTIHYCWFGGNEKSDLIKKCIQSWRDTCPDYEIIEWNEGNFDVSSNDYVKEAYLAEKWAFVSDYARLKIVYELGGIYLDTDVELIKTLDDLLKYDAFFAMQNDSLVATGLGFGASRNNQIVKKIMDSYDHIHFDNNGKLDTTACPIRNTETIVELFGKIEENKQYEKENAIFLSEDYFCPFNSVTGEMNITSNTIGIHWFSASWRPKTINMREKLLRPIKKIMARKTLK